MKWTKARAYAVAAGVCAAVAVFSLMVLADVRPAYSKVVCERAQYPGHLFVTVPAILGALCCAMVAFVWWRLDE